MRVVLEVPVVVAGRTVTGVVIRPPGRRAFDAMVKQRLAAGFTEQAALNLISRLSGLSTIVLRKLDPTDFAALCRALEETYQTARRRLGARRALAAEAKARAELEADNDL